METPFWEQVSQFRMNRKTTIRLDAAQLAGFLHGRHGILLSFSACFEKSAIIPAGNFHGRDFNCAVSPNS
jgi:hypothetical protein